MWFLPVVALALGAAPLWSGLRTLRAEAAACIEAMDEASTLLSGGGGDLAGVRRLVEQLGQSTVLHPLARLGPRRRVPSAG